MGNANDCNLHSVFGSYGLSFVVSDPREIDNPIVYASDEFFKLTQYAPEEILGSNCRILQGDFSWRANVFWSV